MVKKDNFKTDKLEKVRDAVNVCTMCGFCKSVCPSFKAIGWDSALARGRVILSYGLLNGDIPADDSVIENIYTCTTCMDCERRCPSKVKIVDIVELCRSDLVKNGHILSKHKAIADNVMKFGNPFGEKEKVVDTLGKKPKKAKIGYFSGCTAAYRNKATSKAAYSITKLGVETLVLSCAGCYRMFKEEYPKYVKVPFKVQHMTEFLAMQDLKLKPLKGVATYHDPCHLGRHAHVYEEPRKVIKMIPELTFKEMEFNKSTSHCCGGGGGVRSAFPEHSKTIAETRIDEASFADTIITTCPFCVNNLTMGADGKNIKIVDLTELVDELL